MEKPIKPHIGGHACEPEWVAQNHLFSYCVKARPVQAQHGGELRSGKEESRCERKSCLFNAAQR